MTSHYFHAGCGTEEWTYWSDHTRRSYDRAVAEARRMARRHGGTPIVEWWERRHGLRPGDCELVAGAEEVSDR